MDVLGVLEDLGHPSPPPLPPSQTIVVIHAVTSPQELTLYERLVGDTGATQIILWLPKPFGMDDDVMSGVMDRLRGRLPRTEVVLVFLDGRPSLHRRGPGPGSGWDIHTAGEGTLFTPWSWLQLPPPRVGVVLIGGDSSIDVVARTLMTAGGVEVRIGFVTAGAPHWLRPSTHGERLALLLGNLLKLPLAHTLPTLEFDWSRREEGYLTRLDEGEWFRALRAHTIGMDDRGDMLQYTLTAAAAGMSPLRQATQVYDAVRQIPSWCLTWRDPAAAKLARELGETEYPSSAKLAQRLIQQVHLRNSSDMIM